MDTVKLFISAVLNPPSFNDWQSMSSIIDMIVTGFAFLFREVSILSLVVAAVIIVAFVVTLIAQKIKSFWTLR
ncbi:TPA: hypothetical protein PXO86_004150 [Yersinia enterocolitica]|nr:hypothetical protein [Yersinia enterocolitica]